MDIFFETENTETIREVTSFISEWESSHTFETMTSGSTGIPKKIIITKKQMLASAEMTCNFFGLKKGDTAFLCLSISTIGGKMMIVRALTADLRLTVGSVNSQPFQTKKPRYDFVAMVPMQVENALNAGVDLSGIGTIIIGGASISKSLEQKIIDKNINAFQTYGMTETVSHIALKKINGNNQVYKTIPGIQISSENDCLIIHAPALNVHHLKTNDTVEIVSEGEFKWMGRNDFVINSGGVKLHPEQIEEKLSFIIPLPFFVFGLEDDLLGQKLVVGIEGKMEINKSILESILSKYEIPKEIYFFNKFHYTSGNKLNRPTTLSAIDNAEKQVL